MQWGKARVNWKQSLLKALIRKLMKGKLTLCLLLSCSFLSVFYVGMAYGASDLANTGNEGRITLNTLIGVSGLAVTILGGVGVIVRTTTVVNEAKAGVYLRMGENKPATDATAAANKAALEERRK